MKTVNDNRITQLGLAFMQQEEAMIAYWDADLVCRYANDAYINWFGKKPEVIINKLKLQDLLGPLFQKNLPYIKAVLKGKIQVFERDITKPDGEIRHSLATYYPDIDKNAVLGFFVHVADISLFKKASNPVTEAKEKNFFVSNDMILEELVETLRSFLYKDFPGIKVLAKKHMVSATKLKRDFKMKYGMGILGYYRQLQMEAAHKYLANKMYSKKQLSELFGFANPSNFSACYHKFLQSSAKPADRVSSR